MYKEENNQILLNKSEITKRLECIDIYRGFCILIMILINHQGDVSKAWFFFTESDWNGLSPADCIFPAFLFIMGFSINLSSKKNREKSLYLKGILLRFIKLMSLNLFFNLFERIDYLDITIFTKFRIPGVLFRIAIVYLIISLIDLYLNIYYLYFIMFGFFTIYINITYLLYVPDCGKAVITMECFAGGYIDRLIFTRNHMLADTDNEGILSTFTSFYSVFIGYILGYIWIKYNQRYLSLNKMISLVIVITVLNIIVSIFLFYILNIKPNKIAYTLSFAFFQSGLEGLLLIIMYLFVDVYFQKSILKYLCFLKWLGTNSIVIYCSHFFIGIVLTVINVWDPIYRNVFVGLVKDEKFASFLMALVSLLLNIALAATLYINKIFIKL
jgi:predicted acyltransferase